MKKLFLLIAAGTAALFLAGCASTPKGGAEAVDDSVPRISNPDPTGEVDLLDSFEDGFTYWTHSGWENDAGVYADVTDEWATEGSSAGVFEFNAAAPERADVGGDKASFGCKSLLFNDFTGYKKVYLDFNNKSSGPINMVFVVMDTNWAWCQSEVQTLGIGVNKNVIIDLEALNIPDVTAVQYLYICLFEEQDGKLLVDNIRLVK